jgi:hypothetical protein
METWKCLFFGRGRPEVQTSKEHAVPKWIRRIESVASTIKPASSARRREIAVNSYDPDLNAVTTEMTQSVTKALHVTQMTLAVCGDCNTGWMAKLEEEIKGLLTPAIEGRKVRLTRNDTERVALWAAKTAAVSELDHPETARISLEQRKAIFAGRVPDDFELYAARASEPDHFTWVHRAGAMHSNLGNRLSSPIACSVGFAMSPGKLMLLTRSIDTRPSHVPFQSAFPPLSPAWEKIWPISRATGAELFGSGRKVHPMEALDAIGFPDNSMHGLRL